MVGWVGELKYQVFPKDFIKLKIISIFFKRFYQRLNWDRALGAPPCPGAPPCARFMKCAPNMVQFLIHKNKSKMTQKYPKSVKTVPKWGKISLK